MSEYLFVAEADQIQDFIFRASHLSEVVGGSQLLTRFCKEIPQLLLGDAYKEDNVLVNSAGKFVLQFDNAELMNNFGRNLAEAYSRIADGTLTVADPVQIGNSFSEAMKKAEEQLRIAKLRSAITTATTSQSPFVAICTSCGIGLAVTRDYLHPDDPTESEKYLCQACQIKAQERKHNQKSFQDDFFLRPFIECVTGGGIPENFDWTTRPKDVSWYDSRRRYIAYLVADGNNMGKVVEACQDKQQLKDFSESMVNVLRQCLADPTKKLKQHSDIEGYKVPVRPLILGGDDIFALLPAPWAFSFADSFCQAYEYHVGELLKRLELEATPTMSTAVVICKETYPHTLAHQIGQTSLKQAKQLAKTLNSPRSTVNFVVVRGNQVGLDSLSGANRPTLKPYLATSDQSPDSVGLTVQTLLDQRWELRDVPKHQLMQLRQHFDRLSSTTKRAEWGDELRILLQRITRQEQKEETKLDRAVTGLGSDDKDRLYTVKRRYEKDFWHGHAFPDLLEAWNFAFDLNPERERTKYGEQ